MARPLRIQAPGLTYHVTARGTGQMTIYADDADRQSFLNRLGDVADSHELRCHAYCLMSNHYHVVATTSRANLSGAMRQLNGCYAQHWNKRHGHIGHVFQGRFNAQVVQQERYFATVCRYVVLNPVRAGLVAAPEDWAWSSFRATVGLADSPRFLRLEELLGTFGGPDMASGARQFQVFVAAADGSASRLPASCVLGDEGFIDQFRKRAAAASREVPELQRRLRPDLATLFEGAVTRAARATRMAQAYRLGYRLWEIAGYLDTHYTTVSRAIASVPVAAGVRSCRTHRGKT